MQAARAWSLGVSLALVLGWHGAVLAQAGPDRATARDLGPPAPQRDVHPPEGSSGAPWAAQLDVYEGKHFRLRTDSAPAYARELIRRLDQYHDRLVTGLTQTFRASFRIPRTTIVLFERQDDYQRYANQNAPQLTNNGGYYDGGTKTIVTYRYNNSMQLYFHEIIHAVMGELFEDPFFYRYTRPNWPIWFDEGLAEYFGSFRITGDELHIGTRNAGKLAYLVNALETGTFIGLRALLRSPPDRYSGDSMNIYYASSWGLVSFLAQHPTLAERLPLFMMRLRSNQDGLEAFTALFGPDLDALDAEWRAWVGRAASQVTGPVHLFDGHGIEEWTIHEGGSWHVEDGAIAAEGQGSYNYLIRSELPHRLFTVRLKLRLERGTAGLILGNNFHGEYPYYYLVDFSQGRVAVRRSYSATHIEVLRSARAGVEIGRWADVTIRVTADRLLVSVDGKQVLDVPEDRDRYSLFGLYLYHARGSFKDIVLQPEPFRPTGPPH